MVIVYRKDAADYFILFIADTCLHVAEYSAASMM